MSFWSDKEVLVTGGAGFIGSHVVELLLGYGANVTVADNLSNGSLRNLNQVKDSITFSEVNLENFQDCLRISKDKEVIMNIAAHVGGIYYNKEHPGTMFTRNMLIQLNMLEAARIVDVNRFLVVSSACVYRRHCTIPTPEAEGFEGVPEPTNEGYGWAKRMAELQAKLYHKEYGMNIAVARPYNAYGPRDHFEPEKSHVIPALIKRVFDGENPLTVWGDGEQSRAFLYVTDFAKGLALATEKYPVADPLNIGTSEEVKIKELVELVVRLSNKKPKIFFDKSKPSGQPRRNCDITKAKEKIGFEAKIRLEEGLKKTIEWFKNNLKK